jgi:RNA-directed DNA polymerase
MKRGNQLIEKIADMDNLRHAGWQAAKGKRSSNGVLRYQQTMEQNLLTLQQQILNGKVQVGQYHYFTIYEPKQRLICASPFAQQVLHHALMQVCHPYFERSQVFHSYASRIGKGTHAAVRQAQACSRKYSWFLKLDVQQFFASVHHDTLKGQLRRLFKEETLLLIFDTIINSYTAAPGRGMPIGNLTSQYFANHFLAGLDHFILEQLRPGAYVRYMDDMVLWHNDKDWLKQAAKQVGSYVQDMLCCMLKPVLLNHTAKGLPFLGYKIFGSSLRLTQRSRQRFTKKMNQLHQDYNTGRLNEATCQRKVLPLLAFIAPANTMALQKMVLSAAKG